MSITSIKKAMMSYLINYEKIKGDLLRDVSVLGLELNESQLKTLNKIL